MMKKSKSLLIRIMTAVAAICFITIPLNAQPINADQNVIPVSLSHLEEIETTPELWQELDDLDFWRIPLNQPDGYYDLINMENRESLRTTLHTLIENHTVFPYTRGSKPGDEKHKVDTWDIIALADEHPENDGQVLDIYLNGSFTRQLKGFTVSFRYDREHSWPKSLGFKKDTKKNPAYSDCHHLFAAYQPYNASRSNKPYGESSVSLEEIEDVKRPTNLNVERGGTEGNEANYTPETVWETWIGRRGDVARAMFYMELRYDGHVEEKRKEPDLKLTDSIELVTKHNDAWETGDDAYMGLKSVLLSWHREDPVDDLERRHNTIVYLFQGNRNPFIDHPEWVEVLFADGEIPPTTTDVTLWINEFHYDNAGGDQGEFVEVAGPEGTDLIGWSIIAYNGSNGRTYRSLALSGVIDNENTSGFGAISFPFQGLQNGPSDGLALVSPTNEVVQLISYEGTFSAGNGPAAGETSDELGVRESSNTAVGTSLQLRGNGNQYSNFEWHGPVTESPGDINAGQNLNN
jgi:endonuclease I